MAQLILHKDGAYNIYSTVADGPCYENALTLDELHAVLRFEGGQRPIGELPKLLDVLAFVTRNTITIQSRLIQHSPTSSRIYLSISPPFISYPFRCDP